MKISLIPKTCLGKWAVGLTIVFLLFLLSLHLFIASGEKGGEIFFSNLKLAIPGLLAGISSIASFVTGFITVIRSKERSITVFMATTIGFFVLIFVLGEILFPH